MHVISFAPNPHSSAPYYFELEHTFITLPQSVAIPVHMNRLSTWNSAHCTDLSAVRNIDFMHPPVQSLLITYTQASEKKKNL